MRINFFLNIAKERNISLDLGEIFHSLNSREFLKTFLKRRLTISENTAFSTWHEAFCDRPLNTKSCSVSHNMLCPTTSYTSEMSVLYRYAFSTSSPDSEVIWIFKFATVCFETSIGHHSQIQVQSKLCNTRRFSHVKYGEEHWLICSEYNAN